MGKKKIFTENVSHVLVPSRCKSARHYSTIVALLDVVRERSRVGGARREVGVLDVRAVVPDVPSVVIVDYEHAADTEPASQSLLLALLSHHDVIT